MSVVGDRYAESLFDLAKEENQVTQYLDDIKLVGEVLDSDPQIVQFFNHVLIENDKKIQLLDQSFKGNVDQYVLNFLKQLNEEGNTIVMITHDNSIAMEAKRVVRIMDGQVVEDSITPQDKRESLLREVGRA